MRGFVVSRSLAGEDEVEGPDGAELDEGGRVVVLEGRGVAGRGALGGAKLGGVGLVGNVCINDLVMVASLGGSGLVDKPELWSVEVSEGLDLGGAVVQGLGRRELGLDEVAGVLGRVNDKPESGRTEVLVELVELVSVLGRDVEVVEVCQLVCLVVERVELGVGRANVRVEVEGQRVVLGAADLPEPEDEGLRVEEGVGLLGRATTTGGGGMDGELVALVGAITFSVV